MASRATKGPHRPARDDDAPDPLRGGAAEIPPRHGLLKTRPRAVSGRAGRAGRAKGRGAIAALTAPVGQIRGILIQTANGFAMPLRFTLRQLEYFVAVGEAGSIALAAGKVNVSSPSISTAIALLEAEFGVQLFARKHAHGLALTQAGRQMLDEARRLLAAAERLNTLAGEITGQVRGPLHVGCLLTFAQVVLPGLRRSFVTRFAEVAFQQSEHDQQALFDGLRSAELDLALTYDLDIPDDLDFVPLAELPPYALLPEGHPLQDRASLAPADLAPHPMVLLDLPYSRPYFLSFFEAAGLAPNIVERTRDLEVMRALVANGFGFSIANIRHASECAPDGRRLRFVPLGDALRPLRMGIVLPRSARNVMTANAFIEHCRTYFSGGGAPGMTAGQIPEISSDRPPDNRPENGRKAQALPKSTFLED